MRKNSGAGLERPVGVDADHGARPAHAGLAARLKFGAVRLVGAVQDPLRRVPETAGPAAARVFVGMGQHDLVHIDVAVVAGQFLGFEIGDGDLRHDAQHDKARRLERHPGRRRDVDAVRHDRQDVADVELEREQIALPADHLHRVVPVEDRAVPAGVLEPHLVFVLLRPAVIGDVRHLQHRRVDRRVAADLLVLGTAGSAAAIRRPAAGCRRPRAIAGTSSPSAAAPSRPARKRSARTRSRRRRGRDARNRGGRPPCRDSSKASPLAAG